MSVSLAPTAPLAASRPRIPRAIQLLFAADLTVGLLFVLNVVVANALGVERTDFLRSGVEANLPTWYAVVQLALIGLVLLPLAVRDVRLARPSTWAIALGPLFFLLLSLDEGAMVHERIGLWMTAQGAGTETFSETAPWLFALAPLYGLIALATARAWWPYVKGRRFTIGLFVVGAGLLGFCAAGMEGLMFALDAQHGLLGKAMSVVEETGELIAATLMLWGALRLVQAEGIRLVLGRPETHTPAPRATRPTPTDAAWS